MVNIAIRPLDKALDIRFTSQRIRLPQTISEKVEKHWQHLLQAKPNLHNGEVFTVLDVHEDADSIRIRLAETDYAHYLYSRHAGNLGKYTVRIIHPAALVCANGKLIFGSMGPQTSLAGTIQCCGGGIDRRAVEPDGTVAIERTMASELQEEVGIDMYDTRLVASAAPAYLKFGGPTGKMTLVYLVELKQTSEQFLRDYQTFASGLRAQQVEPEFDEIFCIDSDPATVESFISHHKSRLNEYMAVLLRAVARQTAAL